MKKHTQLLILLSFLAVTGCGKSRDIPLSERYPGPWREDFNLGITKALASKDIRGCGQYKYRESRNDKGEYLVHCTRDGNNWTAYLVWANTGSVTGPHAPDISLK